MSSPAGTINITGQPINALILLMYLFCEYIIQYYLQKSLIPKVSSKMYGLLNVHLEALETPPLPCYLLVGENSYPPMSTLLPVGRCFPSKSLLGARSSLPASMAGEPALR